MKHKCLANGLSVSWSWKKTRCKCDNCRAYRKECRLREGDKPKERARQWRLDNLERSRENSRRYQKEHPEMLLKVQLKKYGLSLDEYFALLEKSGGRCMICRDLPQKTKMQGRGVKRLSVDHDRKTGVVRGLLCGNCNVGIGHLNHSTTLLENAMKYLNGDVYES